MKKALYFFAMVPLTLISTNCNSKDESPNDNKQITVYLEPKNDSGVSGTVSFTQIEDQVTMVAIMRGLEVGTHAFHLHEKADCSSKDGKSAGGHWNPTGTVHGKWGNSNGYHKGDIGNFETDAKGYASINFTTNEWCIGCDDNTKNIMGKAIIVHAGEDDYTSQPSGAAGSRVSCGGIIE